MIQPPTFLRAALMTLALASALTALSCGPEPTVAGADAWQKITFDMAQFRDDGLRGPPDGLRSLDYEFCIPATDACKAEVAAIDPTVRFSRGTRGRIGCGKDQYWCLGSTHQEGFREILRALAALPYVKRIDECFFE